MRRSFRLLSRISIRLLAFNILLVFLPAAGFLSLSIYEQQLLEYQERSMVQQGRILAAALGENGPLDAASAERILVNMRRELDARLRIIDRDFSLLADSSQIGPRLVDDTSDAAPATDIDGLVDSEDRPIRDNLLYRFGNALYQLYARAVLPPEPPLRDVGVYSTQDKLIGNEIETALRGSYGAAVRTSRGGQRSLTLYSALPIRSGDQVVGAVLVSKSTFQILGSLYELRLSTFQVILASVLAAIVLSLLVSTTIARPLAKLQQQATALLDRRGRLRGRFKVYRRRDEIGDLSRALAELTRRLEKHLLFIESFASDVSHEFKNPLASIRSATDLLAEVDDPEQRKRFLGMVQHDIQRLERLLTGVREISLIDANLDQQPTERVAMERLLRRLLESYEMRRPDLVFELHGDDAGKELAVDASPDRLSQVLENLLDNAASFSPEGGLITMRVRTEAGGDGDRIVVEIADQGPGIPPQHLERIFGRFFSYRQQARPKDGHNGLGLSIVKAIVEGYGGTISARNRASGGAIFRLLLPAA